MQNPLFIQTNRILTAAWGRVLLDHSSLDIFLSWTRLCQAIPADQFALSDLHGCLYGMVSALVSGEGGTGRMKKAVFPLWKTAVRLTQRLKLSHRILKEGEGIVIDFVARWVDTGMFQFIDRRFASAFGEKFPVRRDIALPDRFDKSDSRSHAQGVFIDIEVVIEMRDIVEAISL